MPLFSILDIPFFVLKSFQCQKSYVNCNIIFIKSFSLLSSHFLVLFCGKGLFRCFWGGWVWQKCCVSYVTGASNWYWLTVACWARPAILVAGKDRGGMCLFLPFLHFHSCSSFFPVPLFHLYYLFYLFSPFLWETTQNDPQGWCVVKP